MKKNYFKNFIGYDNTKKTLERVIDVIENQDKYKKLGSVIPHGLFLYGLPGLGKSTLAMDIINSVNRKAYIIRKNRSNGDFIKYMNEVFEDAKKNQPSIIFLDDIDKFAEDNDTCNNEEFVAVQSFIDDIKRDDIFVIATANDKSVLPKSLLRSGRFDIKIKFGYPTYEDSLEILKYYLNNKKIDNSVNIKNISHILSNCSCADLEKVCNQAGLYAGFKNKDTIGMDEILRASLELQYNTNIEDDDVKDEYALNVAYHEAGHAIVGEILQPKSVAFVTIAKNNSNTRGITKYCNNDYYFDDISFMENKVITLLAGKAATDIVYKKCDTGVNSDMHRAYDVVERFVDNYCMFGFDSWIRNTEEQSEKVKQSKDDKINDLMVKYYGIAKELLFKNRDKLDALAYQLNKKKILFQDEIEDIFNNPKKYKYTL